MPKPSQLAIHGHFYQPDRVNPLTGHEPQDPKARRRSNGKYGSWNEVILSECYKPLAERGLFGCISFDLYRSLAQWLQNYDPPTYAAIIRQVKEAKSKFGTANVLAGPWIHSILPLLNKHDRETNIYWGIVDFEHRFGFAPQGFWLPELAVSQPVLDTLADNGISSVILAPWQTREPVTSSNIYEIATANGILRCAFFNKFVSNTLSFSNNQMTSASTFLQIAMQQNPAESLLFGATDGERYGHHFWGGVEFLDYLCTSAAATAGLSVTTIPAFIKSQPVKTRLKIIEKTSWSCLHGNLQRWQGDCACNYDFGRHMRVSGVWKTILLKAMRTLAREVDRLTTHAIAPLVKDIWQAKRMYVHVLVNDISQQAFLNEHAGKKLSLEQQKLVLACMELERYKLTLFTSCGYFFADSNRPEPQIILENGKMVVRLLSQIAEQRHVSAIEEKLQHELDLIHSNFSTITAGQIYGSLPK